MKKISVIVPIYNVEKYLSKCLSSLAHQSLEDIEILCVNDSSPDESDKIISHYCEKYPDLFVSLFKENGGLSSARNFGIEHASGEYIAFVDGDDFVSHSFCKRLYEKAKENDFDICMCDVEFCYHKNDDNFGVSCGIDSDLFSKEEIKEHYIEFFPAAWNKIYKKDFLLNSGILFKEGVWYEDVEFFHRLLPHVNSIGVVNKKMYRYVQRHNSVTQKNDKRLFDYIPNFEGIIEYYRQNGYFEEYHDELEFATVRYLYATFLKRCAKLPNHTFSRGRKMAKHLIESNFPEWKKNPYLKKSGVKGIYLKFCDAIPEKILKRCIK